MKEFLSRNQVPFEERGVTTNRQYYHELVDELGFTSVPVTLVDGEPVLGYDRARLEDLLNL